MRHFWNESSFIEYRELREFIMLIVVNPEMNISELQTAFMVPVQSC